MLVQLLFISALAVVSSLDVTTLDPNAPQACAFIGAGGILRDPSLGNAIPKDERITDFRFYNIPTDAPPSPTFGAEPFTQDMLLFEELGTRQMDVNGPQLCPTCPELPLPSSAQGFPDDAELDAFLVNPINPLPTREANTGILNPWRFMIDEHLNAPQFNATQSPAEGRPNNADWAHQRWDEFTPVDYVITASTGSRVNTGFRNNMQGHQFSVGEFAPGGLYHRPNTGIEPRFHPSWPIQEREALWTFDGTFPPKLIMLSYGRPVVFRHYNAVPIDINANKGFGTHTFSTHEHNGHSPAESDGFTNAFFFPGQFYDYRWPMQLSGLDFINVDATDPRAAGPDGTLLPGDWRETMSTHWTHDHMLDFTAQNVFKGNFAMINFYSRLDMGNEGVNDGVNIRMPSGTALPFGNRDYDVNLAIADKAVDAMGQLWYNPENKDGFLGDVMTVNLLWRPKMDVRARKYRFRFLNGAVSRYFQVGLITGTGGHVPFHMVANDGNIMEHTIFFPFGELPVIAIGERYDIVVDFSPYVGQQLYFVNSMEHRNGIRTNRKIDIGDIISGAYKSEIIGNEYVGGDPIVGTFLELNVVAYEGQDLSMNPEDFLPVVGETLIPMHRPTQEELRVAVHRTFEYERLETEGDFPWAVGVDAGPKLNTNPEQISANARWGSLEVWRLLNSGSWSHPVHIHAEEAIILTKDGELPPPWEQFGRKDVFRIGPEEESAVVLEIAYRFRDFNGTYMNHCHNTLHEDKAMLIRYDITSPSHLQELYTPVPCWGGVEFSDSFSIATAITGDGVGPVGPTLEPIQQFVPGYLQNITFPNGSSVDLRDLEASDEFNQGPEDRVFMDVHLTRGINIDTNNVETDVWFILHDISNETMADNMAIAWGPLMELAPITATSPASFDNGVWTFFGDLPPPVGSSDEAIHSANTYTSLRQVVIDGVDVRVNAPFMWWGSGVTDSMRIDPNCKLPDFPPSTSCPYMGEIWGVNTGQVISYNFDADPPSVTMKVNKGYTDDGDYFPYYLVIDAFPAVSANDMGVVFCSKHRFIGKAAIPLIQWLPPKPLHPSFPPTEADGHNVAGGGPFGGQVGIPSYFMPGELYTPFWHIGFAHWTTRAWQSIKGIDTLKEFRARGLIEIREFPPAPFAHEDLDDFDFDADFSPLVVNCPVPFTIDTLVLNARHFEFYSDIELLSDNDDDDNNGGGNDGGNDTGNNGDGNGDNNGDGNGDTNGTGNGGPTDTGDTAPPPSTDSTDAASQLTAGFLTLFAIFYALF